MKKLLNCFSCAAGVIFVINIFLLFQPCGRLFLPLSFAPPYCDAFQGIALHKNPRKQVWPSAAHTVPHNFRKGDVQDIVHLPDVKRVWCLSDLHTDHVDNLTWLSERMSCCDFSKTDLIVIAGDISHDLERLEQSLQLLLKTGAFVVFVAGNHEAWLNSEELKAADTGNALNVAAEKGLVNNVGQMISLTDGISSVGKLERVYQRCQKIGVLTGCTLVGGSVADMHPLWILPLDSWYDGSLAIKGCEDLIQDFPKWPWVDFMKCRWPFPRNDDRILKKIPSGLTDFFLEQNQAIIQTFSGSLKKTSIFASETASCAFGIMTISHFLPNQQCLPDWKEITSQSFLRKSWLDHGGGGVSAKFALVAGTKKLDRQIRTMPTVNRIDVRHIHVFGHSHRPKDFELNNIRYVHNPLGKPRERDIHMIDPKVDFKLIWDTTKGEIKGETVIRYWEEKGGGVEMLRARMKKSKRKSRYVFSQKGNERIKGNVD